VRHPKLFVSKAYWISPTGQSLFADQIFMLRYEILKEASPLPTWRTSEAGIRQPIIKTKGC
jgi:hypothetical protein